jgi:hypothetical protein
MVKFTNYVISDANVVDSIKSESVIEAGYFLTYNSSGVLVKANDTSVVVGISLGESSVVDNRVGKCLSVAVQSAGVLVRSSNKPFKIGNLVYVDADGLATNVAGTGSPVGIALQSNSTIDGIDTLLMRRF